MPLAEKQELEPAEHDPVAIRRTVILTIALALISAIFIPWAYRSFLAKRSEEFRPPYEGIVKKNIPLRLIDGTLVSPGQLLGEVWVAWMTTGSEEDPYQARAQAITTIPKGVKQVVFLLDAPPSSHPAAPELLQKYPPSPDVWYVMADAQAVREYVKEQLRVGILPYKKDGLWYYDERVIVAEGVEKPKVGHHLRGTFDFERARQLDGEIANTHKQATGPTLEQRLQERFLRTLTYLQQQTLNVPKNNDG